MEANTTIEEHETLIQTAFNNVRSGYKKRKKLYCIKFIYLNYILKFNYMEELEDKFNYKLKNLKEVEVVVWYSDVTSESHIYEFIAGSIPRFMLAIKEHYSKYNNNSSNLTFIIRYKEDGDIMKYTMFWEEYCEFVNDLKLNLACDKYYLIVGDVI